MEDMLSWGWEHLIDRVGGPLTFRLIIQPAVAIILAIRAGLEDAHEGRPVYCWAIVADAAHRRYLLRHGWEHVGKVFIVAIVLDAIYQMIVLRWIYPGQLLIVATTLAILPYMVVRGLTNFVATQTHVRQRHDNKDSALMTQEPVTTAPSRPDQVQLALERTYLAYERTLMAWVRTATGLITFGFTLYKFFFYLREQEPEKHAEQLIGPRTYGLVMMGLGVLTLAAAAWQHRQQMKRLRTQYAAPFSLSLVLAAFIAVLGILGFLAAALRE
jgi:uncharacterized membrane protein YidH (DUF202 family)